MYTCCEENSLLSVFASFPEDLAQNWVLSWTPHCAASYWKRQSAPNSLQSEPGKWKGRGGNRFTENPTAGQQWEYSKKMIFTCSPDAMILLGVDTVYTLQTVSKAVGSWWRVLCHRAGSQAVPLWKLLGNPNPQQDWLWGNEPAGSVEMGTASSSWDPVAWSTTWNSQGADAIPHLWSLTGTLPFSPELKEYLSWPQDLDFFERGSLGEKYEPPWSWQ